MKPRLAESASDLWCMIANLTESGVVYEGRVLYPVVWAPPLHFRISRDKIEVLSDCGMCVRDATKIEIEELNHDIEMDTVTVELAMGWGGHQSDSGKAVKTLHSPSGRSWGAW